MGRGSQFCLMISFKAEFFSLPVGLFQVCCLQPRWPFPSSEAEPPAVAGSSGPAGQQVGTVECAQLLCGSSKWSRAHWWSPNNSPCTEEEAPFYRSGGGGQENCQMSVAESEQVTVG